MKKISIILLMLAVVLMSASFAITQDKKFNGDEGKKAKDEKEVVEQEKSLTDYFTPIETLVGEYHRIVAQIKQKENEIEALELQLEKIDAVVQYQRSIEQAIEADKKK